jgi:hypothetical protein
MDNAQKPSNSEWHYWIPIEQTAAHLTMGIPLPLMLPFTQSVWAETNLVGKATSEEGADQCPSNFLEVLGRQWAL